MELRVWWIRNPPASPHYYYVNSIDEALRKFQELAEGDLRNPSVKSNAGGLEICVDSEWTEWEDEDGNDICILFDTLNEPSDLDRPTRR